MDEHVVRLPASTGISSAWQKIRESDHDLGWIEAGHIFAHHTRHDRIYVALSPTPQTIVFTLSRSDVSSVCEQGRFSR